MWARTYSNVDDLRQAVADFVEVYNHQWLIARLGHHTPARPTRAGLPTRRQQRDSQPIHGTGSGSGAIYGPSRAAGMTAIPSARR
ncbi:MAG: hypothetical protein ACR2KL_04085 [Nocardioidaceae bacterium]